MLGRIAQAVAALPAVAFLFGINFGIGTFFVAIRIMIVMGVIYLISVWTGFDIWANYFQFLLDHLT